MALSCFHCYGIVVFPLRVKIGSLYSATVPHITQGLTLPNANIRNARISHSFIPRHTPSLHYCNRSARSARIAWANNGNGATNRLASPWGARFAGYFRIYRLIFRRHVGGCLSILATVALIRYFVGDLVGRLKVFRGFRHKKKSLTNDGKGFIKQNNYCCSTDTDNPDTSQPK